MFFAFAVTIKSYFAHLVIATIFKLASGDHLTVHSRKSSPTSPGQDNLWVDTRLKTTQCGEGTEAEGPNVNILHALALGMGLQHVGWVCAWHR